MTRSFPKAHELASACLSEAGYAELLPYVCGPGPKAMRDRPWLENYVWGWDMRQAKADGFNLTLEHAWMLGQARYIAHVSICTRYEVCPFLTHVYVGGPNYVPDPETEDACRQEAWNMGHNPPDFEFVFDHWRYYHEEVQP